MCFENQFEEKSVGDFDMGCSIVKFFFIALSVLVCFLRKEKLKNK